MIYPGTLVAVLLSLFGKKIKSDNVFKFAAAATMAVGLPEALTRSRPGSFAFTRFLPLHEQGFGWVLPAAAFAFLALLLSKNPKSADGASPA
jgi:LIVCS family branched-chain amino acid:cation transporter